MQGFSISILLTLITMGVYGLVGHLCHVDQSKEKLVEKYLNMKKDKSKDEIESSFYSWTFWVSIVYMLAITMAAKSIGTIEALYIAILVIVIEEVEYVSRVINIRKISETARNSRDLVIMEVEYEYKTRYMIAEIFEICLFVGMLILLIFNGFC